jgi:CheY-like chemotaxis protein
MQNLILIVEDSATARKMIQLAVEGFTSFECFFAKTFNEAQNALRERSSDFFAAVLDIHLPDAPNGEIVDEVLKYGIPSIVFTGRVDEETIAMFQKKAIVEYIVKNSPKASNELSTLINQLALNQQRSVLIVDDSKVSRFFFKSLLEKHLFNTFEAHNGVEALEIIEKNPHINLILTDYHMPIMDGFELTSRLRLKYSQYEKAILAITSDGHPLNIAHFLKNGANDFISKPVRKEEFYARIYGLINMTDFYHELQVTQKLLKEHKDAVDERSIVSKTDLKGLITYANDN